MNTNQTLPAAAQAGIDARTGEVYNSNAPMKKAMYRGAMMAGARIALEATGHYELIKTLAQIRDDADHCPRIQSLAAAALAKHAAIR